MEKVKIPLSEKEHHLNWCSRCDKYYCANCVEFHKVDFHIKENIFCDRSDLKPLFKDFYGEMVCPWCYNQLIDKKQLASGGTNTTL